MYSRKHFLDHFIFIVIVSINESFADTGFYHYILSSTTNGMR